MAAAQTTVALRLTALDEATPVTERVRAALAVALALGDVSVHRDRLSGGARDE
jgi:hypothetical protein